MSYTYGRVHQITPFGAFVRNLRNVTGDTVSCMADKLGTTRTRLTQIELGIRSDIVSLYIIKRLNEAYDLTQKEKEELRLFFCVKWRLFYCKNFLKMIQ